MRVARKATSSAMQDKMSILYYYTLPFDLIHTRPMIHKSQIQVPSPSRVAR